jgi:putative FmdB family regulatory protein
MPIYEYQCEQCGEHFEVMQKFSDAALTRHERCGGAVHRLLSAPALQFKGSGWYITDYAKGGGSPENGAPAKTDAGSATKTGSETGSGAPAASTPSSDTKSGSSSETKSDTK